MQQPFYLRRVGAGICAPDVFSGELASKRVQIERNGQPLLAAHRAIAGDLFPRSGRRSHFLCILEVADADNVWEPAARTI